MVKVGLEELPVVPAAPDAPAELAGAEGPALVGLLAE